MANDPHVSITIPIAKRIPIMPWVKIPAATITLSGVARVLPAAEAPRELLRALFRQMVDDAEMVAGSCVIEVTPQKEFVTHGLGVPLLRMSDPKRARGRAPVA